MAGRAPLLDRRKRRCIVTVHPASLTCAISRPDDDVRGLAALLRSRAEFNIGQPSWRAGAGRLSRLLGAGARDAAAAGDALVPDADGQLTLRPWFLDLAADAARAAQPDQK